MMRKMTAALAAIALMLCMTVRAENKDIQLPVVMYHHISKRPSTWNEYVISPEELRSDLNWLRDEGYTPISMKELLAWYDGEFDMPEKPCMITFDDGCESTLAYAEPMLEEFGFCGIVAVIGSVCEKFTQCDEHDPELSNMSWQDCADMARRGRIEVQCHTWNMHSLSPRKGCSSKKGEDEGAYREVLEQDLNKFLESAGEYGVDLTMTIAYPYGAYSKKTTSAVKDMGFLAAFTCNEHVNDLTGDRDELFELGRFNRPHGVPIGKLFSSGTKNS